MLTEQKGRKQGVDIRRGITVWAKKESRAERDVVIPAEQREDPRLRWGGNVPPPTLVTENRGHRTPLLRNLNMYIFCTKSFSST